MPTKSAVVPRGFYLDAPDLVAYKLLGKLLVRTGPKEEARAARIVEVEAYFGEADPAAHSFAGKTARNAVIFGPPGHAYVYFIYGMYFCLNVSCEPEGKAGCILVRALEPVRGIPAMEQARGFQSAPRDQRLLTSGPGRLCHAFGVTRERDNGVDLTDPKSTLQIHQDGFVVGDITVTPRIGISKDVERPARFILAGNRYVSGSRRINLP